MSTARSRRKAAGLVAVTAYLPADKVASHARYVERLGGEAPNWQTRLRNAGRAVEGPDGAIYDSVSQAAESQSVTRVTMTRWCKEKRNGWRYATC